MPPPPLVICKVWVGALLVVDPTKLSEVGEAVKEGLERVRVTATVKVGFMAPGAETVRCPVYVPAANVPGLTLTCTENGVTPDAGGVSQDESLAKFAESPATEDEMERVCAAGATPPAIAVKAKLVGLGVTCFVEGGFTVNETGRAIGLWVAPNEATFKVAL